VIDTNYVVTKGDTIIFLMATQGGPQHTYALPLKKVSAWLGSWIYDEYTIPYEGEYNLNQRKFPLAYNIKEYATSYPNYLRRKDEWFVPRLGMVYRFIEEYGAGYPKRKVFRLYSSQLTPFPTMTILFPFQLPYKLF
jgi:hypothetical protein